MKTWRYWKCFRISESSHQLWFTNFQILVFDTQFTSICLFVGSFLCFPFLFSSLPNRCEERFSGELRWRSPTNCSAFCFDQAWLTHRKSFRKMFCYAWFPDMQFKRARAPLWCWVHVSWFIDMIKFHFVHRFLSPIWVDCSSLFAQ